MLLWVGLLCFLKRIEVHQILRAKSLPRWIISTVDGSSRFIAASVIATGVCLVSPRRRFIPRGCLRYCTFSLTVRGLIGSVGARPVPTTSLAGFGVAARI